MSLLSGGLLCLQCRRLALTFPLSRQYRWKQSTFYDILRVHPEATQAEIKQAYLQLSKEYHPDRNQNVTKYDAELIHTQYVKINQAYSVLGKESERRHYDAQIFVRIEITEQKSSQTKTSSMLKIFGWSIFENTVKHARKKGIIPQDCLLQPFRTSLIIGKGQLFEKCLLCQTVFKGGHLKRLF